MSFWLFRFLFYFFLSILNLKLQFIFDFIQVLFIHSRVRMQESFWGLQMGWGGGGICWLLVFQESEEFTTALSLILKMDPLVLKHLIGYSSGASVLFLVNNIMCYFSLVFLRYMILCVLFYSGFVWNAFVQDISCWRWSYPVGVTLFIRVVNMGSFKSKFIVMYWFYLTV